MLFTKASEYALLGLIYIADKEKPQDVETMAAELEISRSFLAKDGLLKSYKGARGGFALVKTPDKYTIKEIIDSAEKREVSIFECSQGICPSDKGSKCYILPVLKDLQVKMDEHLSSISLADMMKR